MSSTYRVRRGDSLSKIAKTVYKDASLWPYIARANKLKEPFTIFAGQELILPKSCEMECSKPSPSADRKASSVTKLTPNATSTKSPTQTIKLGPGDMVVEPVLLPEWEFQHVVATTYASYGAFDVTAEFTLSVKAKPLKSIVNFSVANFNQIALSSESETTAEVKKIAQIAATSISSLKIDPATLRPSFSAGVTTGVTLDGKNWQETSVKMLIPKGVEITYTRRSLYYKSSKHKLEGEVGLVIKVMPRDPELQHQEQEVTSHQLTKGLQVVALAAAVAATLVISIYVPPLLLPILGSGATATAGGAGAVSFVAAALALQVVPYEKWKGSLGTKSDTPPSI